MLLGMPTSVLSAGFSLRFAFRQRFWTGCMYYLQKLPWIYIFQETFPPVCWENVQGPEIRIISEKCLSLALLLLTSCSPFLARTEHSNFKEKPFAYILHLQKSWTAQFPRSSLEEPCSARAPWRDTELGRPSAVLHLEAGWKVKAAAF